MLLLYINIFTSFCFKTYVNISTTDKVMIILVKYCATTARSEKSTVSLTALPARDVHPDGWICMPKISFLSSLNSLDKTLHISVCPLLKKQVKEWPCVCMGARGSVVGWGTMLQAGRLWVQVPMRSLDFFFNWSNPSGCTMALGST
jgi:hypothetical protein